VNLLSYFSASQSPSNGLTLGFLVTVFFPATTLTFSHSSFLFLTVVFSPWDFYSLRHKKIIIIHRLITGTMSEYMTESEVWAVARWEVGSCLMMVRKTKQVGFEPMFESLHSWSISYGGWDFVPNLGGTVAEGTPTKVSCYSWNIEQLLTGRSQGLRALIRKQKWT